MSLFNKNMIDKIEYDWFKEMLDDDFVIDDKSQVIFGFNGIGKSTLFHLIKNQYQNNIDYIQYENESINTISNKKTLLINTSLNKLNELRNEKEELVISMSIKKNLVSNLQVDKNDEVMSKNNIFESVLSKDFDYFRISKEDVQNVNNKIKKIPLKLFYEIQHELSQIEKIDDEIRRNFNHKKYSLLKSTLESFDLSDDVCPVCDVKTDGLKEYVQSKIKELECVKSTLVSKFDDVKIKLDDDLFCSIKDAYNIISDFHKQRDFFVCEGNLSRYDMIKESSKKISKIGDKIETQVKKTNELFNNLKKMEDLFVRDMYKYFKIDKSKIKFDTKTKTIKVTFPRKISAYSTGEINLIFFLSKIYSYLGSDKNVLILDDPVSSLDMMNHYKIAYEICNTHKTNKHLIILTHSVELINTLNSQNSKKFNYFYLEQFNNKIYKINIDIKKQDNIISLKHLRKMNIGISDEFINAIIKKDLVGFGSYVHKIFHYDVQEHFYPKNTNCLSNYILCDLIENFKSFELDSFKSNSYHKILYLSSLRVYIEKKLFESINSTETDLQKKFLKKNTITERIKLVMKHKDKTNLNDSLTEDYLLSKKVLLNQAVHCFSQILPFSFAINLSYDALTEEINEIKNIFI